MKRNYEDVSATIDEISKEKKKRTKKEVIFTVLKWAFTPFVLASLLFKSIFKRLKLRLGVKATILFTAAYTLLFVVYIVLMLTYFRLYLEQHGLSMDIFTAAAVASAAFVIIFVLVGSIVGTVTSTVMLKPIRDITRQIDGVNSENLSYRLENTDTQDEIADLVKQINSMLESLQNVFTQQSNFVSDASHELKTPLAVISGYSNLLDRWGKTDAAILEEGIEAIKRESLYMNKIVEQLLFLAKLGRFSMVKQKFDLFGLVAEVVEGYKITNPECEIVLIEGKQALIETDRHLLIEAVRAITDNAIKYSRGKVKIFAGEENGVVLISVKDNGLGMDSKDIPHIFDRFYRCDKTRGREKGNAGLGLTICKSVIEMMEGHIEVSSKKGEGSEFKILLERK